MTRKKVQDRKVPMGVSVRQSTKDYIQANGIKAGDMLDILHGICPKCGGNLTFNLKFRRYVCDKCKLSYWYKLDGNKLIVRLGWILEPVDWSKFEKSSLIYYTSSDIAAIKKRLKESETSKGKEHE